MAKTIWGLDFGSWSLKVARAEYDRKSDTIALNLYDEFIYGELSCGYDAGPLEKYREAVIAFRGRHDIGAKDDLCVSVTGAEVFNRFINLPPVPENLDEIIRYEARQQIPFDIDDVVWDYQPVKEEHELGEEIEVGLFALKEEDVGQLIDLLEPWRRNLRVVQNAPLAVYNFLEYENVIDEPCIVLDIGAATIDVLALDPPQFWVRTLLVAGNDLTNALVQKLGVTTEEAEKIKRRAGRSSHREQILRTLQPVFEEIGNEIQRSLGYYKSLSREARFDRILTLGNATRLDGVREAIAEGLQYEVVPVQRIQRMQVADSVDREKLGEALPGACAALGLIVQGAEQGRIRINMVPEEIALAGEVAQKKPWLLGAAAGVLLAALLLIVGERIHAQQVETAEQQPNWQLVDEVEQLESQYESEMQQVEQLKSRIRTLAGQGISSAVHMEVLGALSQTLPADVYLKSLDFSWKEPGEIDQMKAEVEAAAQQEEEEARGGGTGGFGFGQPPDGPGQEVPRPPSGAGGMGGEGFGFAGGGAATAGAMASESSQLVLTFSAETTNWREGREYINATVEKLKQAPHPRKEGKMFSDVVLTGRPREIWRDAVTGEEVERPQGGTMQGNEEVMHFIAFDGSIVVNTGATEGPAGEPEEPVGGFGAAGQ